MTGKKSGHVVPFWLTCDNCNVIICNKDVAIHKEKLCPPNFQDWAHSMIADCALYSFCDIFQQDQTHSELNLHVLPKDLISDFVLVPYDVLQLCHIPLGDHVMVKINGCKGPVQTVKIAWQGKNSAMFGVSLSSEDHLIELSTNPGRKQEFKLKYLLMWYFIVADLYDFKSKSQVIISKVEEKFSPARSVTVVCESDVSSIDKRILLSRLQKQNLNKVYSVGNKILLRHYGSKIIFKVVEMSSCTEDDSKAGAFCLVTMETKWCWSKSEKVEKAPTSSLKLGGLCSVMADVKDVISLALSGHTLSGVQITRGVLIYGPNGTGKTTLIELLAKEFAGSIVRIEHSKVFSKVIGETEKELQNLFELAEIMKPSVILIDDLDILCGNSNSTSEFEKRITATLCLLMDELNKKPEASVVVLATTSKIHKIDKMLRCASRFGKEIDIPVPHSAQRFEILKLLLTGVNHKLNDFDIKSVSDSSYGFVGADLVSLVSKAVLKNYRRCQGKEKITPDDVLWALSKTKPSAMREIMIDIPNVKWDDIGGQEDLKLKLKQCIEWPLKHSEAFTKLGITPPKGVLMFGPPGCSKTMIAKAVATESNLNFISVKGPEIFSKWVGESERAVREVFRRARQAAPSIIFFDELDAIGGERNISSGSNVQERVLAQLLTELDGVESLDNVTVIAATNRLDRIDPALIRPGRLDRIIYVPLPDEETREEIFRLQLRKTSVDADVALGELVERSEGYSGAEVIAVCREAALKALEENFSVEKLSRKHFLVAFNIVVPRTPKRLLEMYNTYLLNTKSLI